VRRSPHLLGLVEAGRTGLSLAHTLSLNPEVEIFAASKKYTIFD
jgi:hypothetical protein